MTSINLNTIDIENNDNETISINVSTLTHNPVKVNETNTKNKTTKKKI